MIIFVVFLNDGVVFLTSYYINYKLMKKKVKHYVRQIEVSEHNREHVLKDFSRVLDNQVENHILCLAESDL